MSITPKDFINSCLSGNVNISSEWGRNTVKQNGQSLRLKKIVEAVLEDVRSFNENQNDQEIRTNLKNDLIVMEKISKTWEGKGGKYTTGKGIGKLFNLVIAALKRLCGQSSKNDIETTKKLLDGIKSQLLDLDLNVVINDNQKQNEDDKIEIEPIVEDNPPKVDIKKIEEQRKSLKESADKIMDDNNKNSQSNIQ